MTPKAEALLDAALAPFGHMQSVQNIVNNSASWRDALDKLQGYDLVFSVHCVKARFGVGDADILAWINGVN